MHDALLAGFAQVDITPKLDSPPTFEIFDPIYLRALHLRQGDKQVTLLAADLFLFDDKCFELVAGYLADSDVDANWVLGGASHMGTGPTLFQYYVNQPTESLKEFGNEDRYARAAAKAILRAREDASPAKAGVGTGEAEAGLQYNRRAHDEAGNLRMVSLTEFSRPPTDLLYDPVDPQVGVVRFDRQAKRPVVLVNFGCHALARWDQRGNISADYPGVMSAALGSEGIDSLFIQGALGNVHPVREGEDPSGRIGRSLADSVLKISEKIAPTSAIELNLFSRAIETGRLPVMDEDEAKRQWEKDPPNSEGLSRYYYWLAQNYPKTHSYSFDVRVITIGDKVLIHMPGEPFVETALAIRETAPFSEVLLLCNPCPEAGYLPTHHARLEGDGEVLFAPLGMKSEAQIRDGTIDLLRETHLAME
jgi:hypothetical protein